jgi:hypothetical protein
VLQYPKFGKVTQFFRKLGQKPGQKTTSAFLAGCLEMYEKA